MLRATGHARMVIRFHISSPKKFIACRGDTRPARGSKLTLLSYRFARTVDGYHPSIHRPSRYKGCRLYFALTRAIRGGSWLKRLRICRFTTYRHRFCLTLLGPAAAKRQPSGAPAMRSVAGRAAAAPLRETTSLRARRPRSSCPNRGRASPVNCESAKLAKFKPVKPFARYPCTTCCPLVRFPLHLREHRRCSLLMRPW